MNQKLTSFSDRIVKKVKTEMKSQHLESTLNLKAYFKSGMPRSLLPKMKPKTEETTEAYQKEHLESNLIWRAISLLPPDVLPNCILRSAVIQNESSLVNGMVEYKNIVKEYKEN